MSINRWNPGGVVSSTNVNTAAEPTSGTTQLQGERNIQLLLRDCAASKVVDVWRLEHLERDTGRGYLTGTGRGSLRALISGQFLVE